MNQHLATHEDFSITEKATERVAVVLKHEGGTFFRVAVTGGGCSGFQYNFSIDNATTADDIELTRKTNAGETVKIVIDTMSLEFVAGSTIDFVDELAGQYFQITNPNATASCGCGTSFAL